MKALKFAAFVLYERIRLNLINPRVLKIERGLHVKMLDSVPFTVRPLKNATCLRGHFAQYDFKKSPHVCIRRLMSDQKMSFFTPVFRPDLLNPYPFSHLTSIEKKLCHHYLD